jgi:putative PEP-CTERM system TPR-repeat lipoprotein
MSKLTRAIYLTSVVLALAGTACTKSPEQRRQQFIAAGQGMMEKKDFARAVLEFKNAAQVVPNHPEAYYRLGLAYLASGDYKRGIPYIQKTLEIDPKHAEAQLKLSELMILTDDPTAIQEANDRLQKLLTSGPASTETMTAVAVAEWKLSQRSAAEKHLMDALGKAPGNLTAAITLAKIKMEQNDFGAAEKALRSVTDQAKPTAEAFVTLGEFYLVRNQVNEAALQFKKASEVNPKHSQALMDLAVCELSAGRWDGAEKVYRQAAALPGEATRNVHALFLLQSGKRNEAIQEFLELTKKYPNDRDARSGLVSAYVSAHRLPEAEAVLTAAIQKNAKDVPALLQRADMLLIRHNLDAVEVDLQAAVREEPDSPQAHFILSHLYGAKGDSNRQRQQLDEALRLNPGFLSARLALARAYTNSNSAKLALGILNQAPAAQKDTPALVAERNWAYLALGQKAEVEKALQRHRWQQNGSDLLLQDAMLKLDRKLFDEARKLSRDALAANPEDVRGLQLLLQSYASERRLSEGLAELKQYAANHAASASIQQFAGTAAAAEGDEEYARVAFGQARTADPGSPAPYLALAQLDIHDQQFDRAQAILKELVAKDTKNTTAYLWLGHLALMKEKDSEAQQFYQKVLELDSNNIGALNNLAYILSERTRQPDQALSYAQKARELAPGSGSVANTLGMVYYRKGLYSLAIPLLKSAAEVERNPNHLYDLGFAYVNAGDIGKGRETLKAALQMDSHLPKAVEARQILASSAK